MESFRLGADGIYRCDAFQQFIWQEHGFGTRTQSPHADVTLRQIHSAQVVNAGGIHDRSEEGDALITDRPKQSIGIRTADCVPILLLDTATRSVAAVHAGWRGTAADIVKRTLEAMRRSFGSEPQNIHAALGPCIRPCCYRVGAEVFNKFSAIFPELECEKSCSLDLAEANRRQMQTSGVLADRIFDSGLCTTCEATQFYSYRREPDNPGRMVSAISRLA